MVADDKRPLKQAEDPEEGEEMNEVHEEEEVFKDPIPGLVEDDGEMQPLTKKKKKGVEEVDHDEEETEEEDESNSSAESSLDPDASHVFGRKSFLSSLIPSKGYTVFAAISVLALVCFLAVPIVCLGASYQMVSHRDTLPATVGTPASWTLRMLNMDRLFVRLKVYSLYGDVMLLPGDDLTLQPIVSTMNADGTMKTWSPAALSILADVNSAFKELEDTMNFIENHNTEASQILDTAFRATVANSTYTYILDTFIPQVTSLFLSRRTGRMNMQATIYTLFMDIFPSTTATRVAAAILLTSEVEDICAQEPACVTGGGLALIQTIQSTAADALFRGAYDFSQTLLKLNEFSLTSVTTDQMIAQIQSFNAFLTSRNSARTAAKGKFATAVAQVTRLAGLQQSTGPVINTTVVVPTAAERSLVAMLPAGMATSLLEVLTEAESESDRSYAILVSQITSQIQQLLANYKITSVGLRTRFMHQTENFNSIYSWDFESLGMPSTADQQKRTLLFNANPLNSFFPKVRSAYQRLISEATQTAISAAVSEDTNSVAADSTRSIQIVTAICTIVPAFLYVYLVYGVTIRLPTSPFPFSWLLVWIVVAYLLHIIGGASIAMISINQLHTKVNLTVADMARQSSVGQASDRASVTLTTAMDALLLIQPNLSTVVPSVQTMTAAYTSILQLASDFPNYSELTALVANVTDLVTGTNRNIFTMRDYYSALTTYKTALSVGYEGVTNETDFDALPLCNKTRVLGAVNFLLDSYGSLLRIAEIATLGQSALSSRVNNQPVRSGKLLGCSRCGLSISQAFDASCLIPSPLGLQTHPRSDGAPIQLTMYATRSGWAIDSWDRTSTSTSNYVSDQRAQLMSQVQQDTRAWKLTRRLIVWFSVLGALLLQCLLYAVWRATFDHTLHVNLLP